MSGFNAKSFILVIGFKKFEYFHFFFFHIVNIHAHYVNFNMVGRLEAEITTKVSIVQNFLKFSQYWLSMIRSEWADAKANPNLQVLHIMFTRLTGELISILLVRSCLQNRMFSLNSLYMYMKVYYSVISPG